MIRGFFLSKYGIVLIAMSVLVFIPTVLLTFDLFTDSIYVETLTNPFTTFAVMVFIMTLGTYNLFRQGWRAVLVVSILLVISYVYVITFIM